MTQRSEDIKTPLARLSFPHLLKPQRETNEKTGAVTEKYNCVLLLPKAADISALKTAAVATAVAQWGDKATQWIKDGIIKSPFLDGDGPQGLNKKTGERHEGYAGCTFLRVSSMQKPRCVDQKVQPILSEDELYAGCYVFAVVHCFSWENDKQGKGISFGISMLQKAKDGERLGGSGGDPSQYFESIAGDDAAGAAPVKDASDLFN